jgi:RNA polymerase sigma-70 factor (ECF subfamily)
LVVPAQPSAGDWQQLLAAARDGSPEALGRLLDDFRPYLQLLAGGELGGRVQAKVGESDLVQDSLVNAVRCFDQFAGGSPEELRAWLRQILLRQAANCRRHFLGTAKRHPGREVPLGDGSTGPGCQPADPADSPSQQAADAELRLALERALLRLPEHYRQVIVWRSQERRPFEEIGRLLGRSPDAARVLWGRAVEALRDLLEPPS